MSRLGQFEPPPPLEPLPDLSPLTSLGPALDSFKKAITKVQSGVPPAMQKQLQWCGEQLDKISAEMPATMEGVKAEIEHAYASLQATKDQIDAIPAKIEESAQRRREKTETALAKMAKLSGKVPAEKEEWHERVRQEVTDYFLRRSLETDPTSDGPESSHIANWAWS